MRLSPRWFALRRPLCVLLLVVASSTLGAAQESSDPSYPPYEPGDDLSSASAFEATTDLAKSTAAMTSAAAQTKKRADLKKTVAGAYKPLFYDNNFAYIDNPLYDDWFPGDRLKRLKVGDCAMLDIGGQYRMRFQDERNIRGFGLTGLDDSFLLYRTRLFANLQVGDDLRIYAEAIDSVANYERFPPRGIEEDRGDLLNLFVDVVAWENYRGKLTLRAGRQELLYGSERLISPLDWANTRRTFEGYKLMWAGEKWNVDAFYTRPVIADKTHFDSPSYSQEFYGTYATYKAIKNQTLDFYGLVYENQAAPNDFRFYTVGNRWLGSRDAWLWEVEGGMQFGRNTNGSDHWATFATVGGGRKFDKYGWKPTLWLYCDYASGGAARGAGTGFNHLFPLAHKYLGFMDLYGRSNIESPNVLLTMQPHEKLKVLCWYYYFFLEDGRDTPYNVTMAPFNPANTPASRDLGHEIDFITTYTINPRSELLFGYSHFFAGRYYKQTPGVPTSNDGDFFYTQYHWNF